MKRNISNIIKESIRKQLLEYVQPDFNFKDFNDAIHQGYSALFQYCTKTLGQKVGQGTSRVVFDFEDDTVLKIAGNDTGRVQNEQEYEIFRTIGKNPLIPKIYDADTDSFIWLLSESVLPAKEIDFEKILGIPYSSKNDPIWRQEEPGTRWDYSEYENAEHPFDEADEEEGDEGEISYLGFLSWYSDYVHDYLDYTDDWSAYETEQYRKLMQTDWFQNLLELFEFQDPDEFFLENFGIAMRNGKPTIVVLDIGWNSEKM